MAELMSRTSSENLAVLLTKAGVSRNVFFYVVLGMISGARKLLAKRVEMGRHLEEAERPPIPVAPRFMTEFDSPRVDESNRLPEIVPPRVGEAERKIVPPRLGETERKTLPSRVGEIDRKAVPGNVPENINKEGSAQKTVPLHVGEIDRKAVPGKKEEPGQKMVSSLVREPEFKSLRWSFSLLKPSNFLGVLYQTRSKPPKIVSLVSRLVS